MLSLVIRHPQQCHNEAGPACALPHSKGRAAMVSRAQAPSVADKGRTYVHSVVARIGGIAGTKSQQRKCCKTAALSCPQLEPDPAADDLDLLVAQTTAAPAFSSNAHISKRPRIARLHGQPSSAVAASQAGVTDTGGLAASKQATGPRAAASSAAPSAGPAIRQPRYTAADKLQLSEEAARDIARRLRTARAPQLGQPVLRIFRYAIDDLRLYKAIDSAGLEGRVIVVDAADFADAVVTTRKKRTGKTINQAEAKRAAANAGVPCIVLKAVSAQRLLEALGPMLGDAGSAAEPRGSRPRGQHISLSEHPPEEQQVQSCGLAHGQEPRLLQRDELGSDDSQELQQLLWASNAAPPAAMAGSSIDGSSTSSASYGPRWQAWHAHQTEEIVQELFRTIAAIDIEDTREYMLPQNPNARAGEKYTLLKPHRHHSLIRRRRLNKQLAANKADW